MDVFLILKRNYNFNFSSLRNNIPSFRQVLNDPLNGSDIIIILYVFGVR